MTYPMPSTHSDLENTIDPGPPPERSSKSKGKQREVLPLDNAASSIRPLPRIPPLGLGITTPGMGDVNWEGSESATGFIAPAGHTGSSLMTPAATTTSSASSMTSSSSTHNSSATSSVTTSSSSHNLPPPLRSALVNSNKSHTSVASSARYASPSSTKFQSITRTTNSPSYSASVPPSASTNPPSASSSNSPIPISWASRPVEVSPQNTVNRGYTLPTPSNSRPPTQMTSPPSQQPRVRVSSVTGVRPPLGTSIPVVAYGNRNRSASSSMGAGSSGPFGSHTIMGARARSQSRTRTGTVNVSILPTGNGSSVSRRSSRDRDRSVDASSQKSTSMPSSPVMKGLHMPFSTSPNTISTGFGKAGTSTPPFTHSSSRPGRTLPSPVLPSGSLNSFLSSSGSISARSIPRNQVLSSSPRQPAILSSAVANTTGKRALPPSPPSIPVGRPLGRREPSIPRSTSQNTPLRKLPQPSLAAHIASIATSSSRATSFASSASPLMTNPTPSPSISMQPNLRAQSATTTATHHFKLPKDILSATAPLSYTSYSEPSSSIIRDSEKPSHAVPNYVMDILSSTNILDDDDDRSSLSSFRASRRRGRRDTLSSDLEEDLGYHTTDELDDVLGDKGVLSRLDRNAQDPNLLDVVVVADNRNRRTLTRSPSPMRYARPESMGLFSSSEDEDLGMRRRGRGREGRNGAMRPPMTWTVAVNEGALGARSDSSDGESGSAAGRSEAGSENRRRGRRTQLRAFRNSYRSGPFVNGAQVEVISTGSGSGNVEGSIGSNEVDGSIESTNKGSDRWWRKLKVKDKVLKTKD